MSNLDFLHSLKFAQVKDFVRHNWTLLSCIAANLILFTFIFHRQEATNAVERQIDSLNIKSNLITKQMADLNNISTDLQSYKKLWTTINQKCFDFGNKTALYKFIVKMENSFGAQSGNISISTAYDLTNNKVIVLNQDVSEYGGHYLLVDFKVTFQSSFSTLTSFLQTLQSQDYLINVKELEIKDSSKVQTNTTDDTDDTTKSSVSTTITFTMFGKIEQPGGIHA